MNLAKFKAGFETARMLAHWTRQQDENGEYVTYPRSQGGGGHIHHERTQQNYTIGVVRDENWIKERLKNVYQKPNQKSPVQICDIVVTLPRTEPKENTQAFMQAVYDSLTKMYGKYNNVVGAWVHMDEAQPHLHFAFLPISPNKSKQMQQYAERLAVNPYWPKKSSLQQMHRQVQRDVDAALGHHVDVTYTPSKDRDEYNKLTMGQLKAKTKEKRQEFEALEKHKIKAEYEAEFAEEKAKAAQNEQAGIEAGRVRAAEDLVKRNAVIDDEDGIEYKEPTFGENYYKLTPEAYKRLRRTAQDGAAAASELLRVVPERDSAVTKLELSQRKQVKVEHEYVQKLTDLRKEASMYLDAPVWARQNLQEDMEYYQRYRSDVDKGIVAAYCTAGDSLSHNDRLEVAGEYARPYMSRLRGEEVSKHDALEYSRQCVSECDRQVSGGRSSSPDGWHHRASDTDYSKAPETEDVKIPRLPKDEQSSDSVTYWPLLNVFEKIRRLMKEIRRMI